MSYRLEMVHSASPEVQGLWNLRFLALMDSRRPADFQRVSAEMRGRMEALFSQVPRTVLAAVDECINYTGAAEEAIDLIFRGVSYFQEPAALRQINTQMAEMLLRAGLFQRA